MPYSILSQGIYIAENYWGVDSKQSVSLHILGQTIDKASIKNVKDCNSAKILTVQAYGEFD